MTGPIDPDAAHPGVAHPHPGIPTARAGTNGPITTYQVAAVLTAPVTVAQRMLPDSPVPLALGTAALAVVGLVEWPVAIAVGLDYTALRQWRRPTWPHG